jgi:hypothetical protein
MSSDQSPIQTAMRGKSAEVSHDAHAMMMFQANQKSVLISYLLWFFFGGIGGHRFYNGKAGTAVIQIALLILGSVMILGGLASAALYGGWTAVPLGVSLLICVGLWVLVDAFLIPGWVRAHNNRLAIRLSDK